MAFATTALLVTGGYMLMPFGSVFTVNNLGIALTDLPTVYLVSGGFTIFTGPLVGRASDAFGKFRTFVFGCALSIVMVLVYTHLGRVSLVTVIVVTVLMFVHCCPAILLMARGKSLVENRKTDFLGVVDLNLDLGDWGFSALVIPNVRRQTCFRATDGFSSVAHISSLRRALPVELPHKNVLPSGSISVHGLRAIDLPREPA